MTTGNYKLSICIPTFNRLQYLKELLEVLLPQSQKYGVQVCVSDNCSEDATESYLREMAFIYPCLCYKVNGQNIGLDRNMQAAISMGDGEYIYPLGDDDLIPEYSIGKILKEIENPVDMIVLNGWHTDASLRPLRLHLPILNVFDPIATPAVYFYFLWDKMPFGSFLAKRDLFSKKYFDKYIGTSHAYSGAVWDALADRFCLTGSCLVKCTVEPMVLIRGAEKTWKRNAAFIMLNEIPKWFDLIMEHVEYKQVSKNIKLLYLKNQTSMVLLLRYRAIGQLDYSMVPRLAQEFTWIQLQKMKLVSLLPKSVVNLILWVRQRAVVLVKLVWVK